MNCGNLRPFERGTAAAAAGRAGGIASGAARRRKRALKRALHEMLSVPLPDDEAEKLKVYGIDAENADYQAAVAAALVKKAMAGNIRAIGLLATLTADDPYVQVRQGELRVKQAELRERVREYDIDRADRQGERARDDDMAAAWLDAVIAMTGQGPGTADGNSPDYTDTD